MRIISTFNQSLYDTSGKYLLESIREHLECDLLLYTEDMAPIPGAQCLEVRDVPEFEQVRQAQREVISEDNRPATIPLEGFNKRWFNWFRKIVAEYDAMVRHPYPGITVFLDSDIRVIKRFDSQTVRRHLDRPVGVFCGTREAVETGMIFYDGTHSRIEEYLTTYIGWYLSGEFRRFPRWDDSYSMSMTYQRHPDLVRDFADGKNPVKHQNSNGHTTSGHVLPITVWGEYLEHDKGIHWRKGIADNVSTPAVTVSAKPAPAPAVRAPWYLRLLGKTTHH